LKIRDLIIFGLFFKYYKVYNQKDIICIFMRFVFVERKNTKVNLAWPTLRLKFEKLVKKAETFQGTYYFFDVTETTNRTSRPQNF